MFLRVCYSACLFFSVAQAKIAIEVDGGFSPLTPGQFHDGFSEDYIHYVHPSPGLGWSTWHDSNLYDASLSLKYFLNDNLALKLTGSAMLADMKFHYKLEDTTALHAYFEMPMGYVGIGADYYQPLFSGLSLIGGVDGGLIFQTGLNYNLYSLKESDAKAKLSELDIVEFENKGDAADWGDTPELAANLKIGVQYLFSNVFGVMIYGGYRFAELMVKYPDDEPFNQDDSFGDRLFNREKINLSGPFVRAGIVVHVGDDQPKKKKPFKMSQVAKINEVDKTPTLRLRAYDGLPKAEYEKYLENKKAVLPFVKTPDKRLELYMASTSEKPTTIPKLRSNFFHLTTATVKATKAKLKTVKSIQVAPRTSIYSSASAGRFVDKRAITKRWFAFNLDNAPNATAVLWQVSTMRFQSGPMNWKKPMGLIKSKKIAASQKEFMIDFKEVQPTRMKLTTKIFRFFNSSQTYYVRALPIDQSGHLIGDAGEGIEVVYGQRKVNALTQKPSYELWTPWRRIGKYHGENMDLPKHLPEVTIHAGDVADHLFDVHDLKDLQAEVVIQVKDSPFTKNDPLEDSRVYLYSRHYYLPTKLNYNDGPKSHTYPAAMIVPFHEFGKKHTTLKEGEFTKYYVRGVVLKAATTPGAMDAALTDTVVVNYGKAEPVTWYGPPVPKYVKVNRSLPVVRIKNYVPMELATQDYLSHYYVFRAPKALEINCVYKNGDIKLYPYVGTYRDIYVSQGIATAEQYEQEVIPQVLPVGQTVYFPPPEGEEEKEWYEQLYDGVVEFFTDLFKVSKELFSEVSDAYATLKMGLITAVASVCPPEYRGKFKSVVAGFVNYGLVVVGVPPTLPNFDDLASMSIAYMADVALTQAGVPENDYTGELTAAVGAALVEQLNEAAYRPAPNPVKAKFLKLDPKYMYRPAYVDIEMKNDSNVSTIAGSFDLSVTFEFDYYTMFHSNVDPNHGITFNAPNNYAVGSGAAWSSSLDYQRHFLYGLNGNTVDFKQGEKAIYDVFKAKLDQPVPVLRPHEKREVRIYLEPHPVTPFERYPTGHNFSKNDFEVIYYFNGNKKFTNFYLYGHFLTANEYMQDTEQGEGLLRINEETDYLFENDGGISDVEKERPVSVGW